MKILVLNAGSSSLKYQLIDTSQRKALINGIVDAIFLKNSYVTANFNGREITKKIRVKNHEEAIKICLNTIIESRVVKDISEIEAVAHRVVHGGLKYNKPTLINNKVIRTLEMVSDLAPLHNPPNILCIKISKKILRVKHIAIFDTAFHSTIPEKAFFYALPMDFYKRYGIRRFGFHGTSHSYVSKEAIRILNETGLKSEKIITCHVGNGVSITAVLNGKSVDTTMGFTPLEGVPMGTRSGSIDPGIIFYLMKKGYSYKELERILNKESGLYGISGISSDMRVIREAMLKNNKKGELAKLAFEIQAYSIGKAIAGYGAVLNGIDAIVFTGGIGENAYYFREKVCGMLNFIGVEIDDQKNKNNELFVSKDNSLPVLVIKTNEELEMALEAEEVLRNIVI
ncbi:MAG: acetate/propionate family kinase [Candidatus Woesearchaeota archaeon]